MNVYAGIFLTALATMAFEITLTRLLSVVSWYHLAFFAVSTAMLGMTAGAVTVYLNGKSFTEKNINASITAAAAAFGLSIPVALAVICFTPVVFAQNFASVFKIIAASSACILPFYFSGIVITAVLTKMPLPTGKIYAADLAGASLGCLFVLWGLDLLDAPNLILLCAPVAALAAVFFSRDAKKDWAKPTAISALIILSMFLSANVTGKYLQPRTIKEGKVNRSMYLYEKWNSFSWIVMSGMSQGWPHFWAASPSIKHPVDGKLRFTARQHYLMIDGLAGTNSVGMSTPESVGHLKYDMVNLAYHLRPGADVCVIGVGGGRDITSAVAFGSKSVLGVEVNPIFINLLKKELLKFANLANRQDVRFVVDDARSYLARSKEKFSIIQMSLIDTWAATGAGAFTLSENGLYTVEAWKIFMDRLADDGIFTVTRWFNPHQPGETARIISLASAALLKRGAADPSRQIILVDLRNVSTVMVCNRPYTQEELDSVKKLCADMQFDIMVFPGEKPGNVYLQKIMEARSLRDIRESVKEAPLNYSPPTDETPYFFNMLKLDNLDFTFKHAAGVLGGNLQANLTLLALIGALLFFTVITIVLPLLQGKKAGNDIKFPAAAYFSLIGAGFMLAEIALIQKLSVFLGHPVYALGILLFSMIASAGAGSYFSEKLPLDKKPWTKILPAAIGGYIIFLALFMPVVTGAMVPAPMPAKITAALLMIIPMGAMMGMCFPAGMRIINSSKSPGTPWYWALNGIFGVLCSALAVFISIYSGISTNLYISALCYLSLLYFMPRMGNKSRISNLGSRIKPKSKKS